MWSTARGARLGPHRNKTRHRRKAMNRLPLTVRSPPSPRARAHLEMRLERVVCGAEAGALVEGAQARGVGTQRMLVGQQRAVGIVGGAPGVPCVRAGGKGKGRVERGQPEQAAFFAHERTRRRLGRAARWAQHGRGVHVKGPCAICLGARVHSHLLRASASLGDQFRRCSGLPQVAPVWPRLCRPVVRPGP